MAVKHGSWKIIGIRGAGDLASGVAHRLHRCGYRVFLLESSRPSAIRRGVSFSEAVYEGESFVEGVLCRKVDSPWQCQQVWEAGEIALLIDEKGDSIWQLQPDALIDAILAKKNLGTVKEMAPLTIALGPGFCAGEDVDFVIETMRGHDLGRIIEEGFALPNTGVPGEVAGVSKERVIHAPASGVICLKSKISDVVNKGQIIASIGDTQVEASIDGVLRGIIREGYEVAEGMKIADIDPRVREKKNCYSISDKARCISGSVVEVLLNQGCY